MLVGRTVFMLGLTVVCAMAAVNARFQERSLVKVLEKARFQEQQLHVEWGSKQVQQVAVSKNDRIVAQVARQNMQHVNPSSTYYMTPTDVGVKDLIGELKATP